MCPLFTASFLNGETVTIYASNLMAADEEFYEINGDWAETIREEF